MKSSNEVVLLVDGNNALWRAFHIFTGVVGASYGFLRQLKFQLEKFQVKQCFICWDGRKASESRKKLYPEYKAGRDKADVDFELFYNQYPFIRKLLKLMGVIQVEHDEMEADDSIATIIHTTVRERKAGVRFIIVSMDRDMLPLVQRGVSVFQPVKDRLIEAANFPEVFGMTPYQYFQFRVLSGDSSDNIKGVTGEKGAEWIVQTFGSLDHFLLVMSKLRADPEGAFWVWDADADLRVIRKKLQWKKFQAIMEDEKLEVISRNLDLMAPKIETPLFEIGRLREERLKRIFLKADWKSLLTSFGSFIRPFRELAYG